MSAGEPLRVVIVDDHPMVVDGLRMALDLAGMNVVGTAGSVAGAVSAATEHRPDVIVMDIQLPDGTGVDATRAVLAAAPGAAVLMLTMLDEPDTVMAAVRAGARGYVVKGATRDEIVRAVTAVAGGEAIFGASVATQVLAGAAAGAIPDRPAFDDRFLTRPLNGPEISTGHWTSRAAASNAARFFARSQIRPEARISWRFARPGPPLACRGSRAAATIARTRRSRCSSHACRATTCRASCHASRRRCGQERSGAA